MYSEGVEVGENCKTILLKSLLSQNITAAIQRQSPGALRLPTCLILAVLKASLLLTVRQRTRMASFFTKIALPLSPLVMKKENHAVSSLILFGIFDFGYDRALFFLSLSIFCLLSHCHVLSLSLSLSESLWAPFFMLLSSQRDGDNDLNEGGWGKERNWEFVW